MTTMTAKNNDTKNATENVKAKKVSAIETAIRNTAMNKLAGKYNLAQYKEGAKRHQEKVNAMLHKAICEQIVDFKDRHPDIPIYFILSVGIAKGAYKMTEFNKGYKKFKPEEVEQVARYGQAYNAYNGVKSKKLSDVTIRLMMRYYEKVSEDFDTFMNDLDKSQVLGKVAVKRGDYGQLCKNLNIPFDIKPKENNVEETTAQAAQTDNVENTSNNAPQATENNEVDNNTTEDIQEPHAA